MSEQEPKTLDLTGAYETATQIEEGQEFDLDSGLRVLVCRGGSPEFYKWAAAAGKKFGRGRAKEIPGEKNLDSLIWVIARANFKCFKGPEGETVISVNGKEFDNSIQGREGLLHLWPDFRDEIMRLAGSTAEEFQMEIDEAGKG